MKKKKVAAVVTEYRYHSHAEVILGRLLGEFDYTSSIEIVSMYTDQVPDNDMSRDIARKYNIPIYSTVTETIRCGYSNCRIDGVIIIGEQGNYPMNEKNQKLYPRRLFFEETIEALDQMGICVPIFSDKHLAYDMRDATWMYNVLKQRQIPFMGGSSIPLLDPYPNVDQQVLATVKEILVIGLKENEINGYHAMDVLQSLVENRQGGETGVAYVQAIEGDDVWDAMDRGEWPEKLMVEALSMQDPCTTGHPRDHVEQPALFTIQYVDGTIGYVLQLEKYVKHWSFAFFSGEDRCVSARYSASSYPYDHFEKLTSHIEQMMISQQSPFPLERTYMSTGLINLGMESLYKKKRVTASDLSNIRYTAST